MVMTEEEILREAARIRASRRRRIERTCMHCGTTYEGLVHRRYCSDRCRVAAARQRQRQNHQDDVAIEPIAPRAESESLVDYFRRVGDAIASRGGFVEDSTELVRRSREERTAELMRALGWEPDEPSAEA